MTDKPVSRKDAKCAKAAKERKDFHFAFLRGFATLRETGLSVMD